ncbi:tryptophan RNA-binding attenuation protein [Ammoniphilus sp. 3BR4]|uniref:tryptophan RNA-binding attenuation protein n=1 Tax=Ammoniphilus sp. 3BR4 TaxID=3158265 RepID=UPI003465599C
MSIIAMDDLEQQCWECNGKGKISEEACPKCDGKGYIATALGQTLLDFFKRYLEK